jgi:molecular chaperone Hsp33
VARLLGETVVLAVTLAATLKYDGVFTLQLKGDGPVSLAVADVQAADGERRVRGYARFDAAAVSAAVAGETGETGDIGDAAALLGRGWLAFTVDQGGETERYQGIVALSGATLAECVQHYFQQSEQLPTGLRLALAPAVTATATATGWHGAALLVQRLPGDADVREAPTGSAELDDWRRAMVLMATLGPGELLDAGLSDHDLLYRLFHEDGVRVFEPASVTAGCRCSHDRVARMLRSLPRAELEAEAARHDGAIEVTCEFCNAAYRFDASQLDALFQG